MTKLTEQIKKSGDGFVTRFCSLFGYPVYALDDEKEKLIMGNTKADEFKSYLTSSQLELLKVLKGEVEGRKIRKPKYTKPELQKISMAKRVSFNSALSQVLELIDNTIKENE